MMSSQYGVTTTEKCWKFAAGRSGSGRDEPVGIRGAHVAVSADRTAFLPRSPARFTLTAPRRRAQHARQSRARVHLAAKHPLLAADGQSAGSAAAAAASPNAAASAARRVFATVQSL